MIHKNRHKYSVSAMCDALQIARSTFHYDTDAAVKKQQEKMEEEETLKKSVLTIFNKNRKVFGTRKIKDGLLKVGHIVSRRRIGRFMNELGIKS